jgi:hypothetical protein
LNRSLGQVAISSHTDFLKDFGKVRVPGLRASSAELGISALVERRWSGKYHGRAFLGKGIPQTGVLPAGQRPEETNRPVAKKSTPRKRGRAHAVV